MTKEAQRKAIAEAIGIRNIQKGGLCYLTEHTVSQRCGTSVAVPDYPNDLDAMHEAENWYFSQCKTVDEKSLWLDNLAVVAGWKDAESLTEAKFISDLNCSRATAAQRAEAFLRTLGLWKDDACPQDEISTTANPEPKI